MMLIATRILKLRDDHAVEIPVRVFAPVEGSLGWQCDFEIGWPDGPRKFYAAGEDAVQALELVLRMIGVNIYTSDLHQAGRLMWLEPGRGYGFPVTNNVRDLLEGDDATYL